MSTRASDSCDGSDEYEGSMSAQWDVPDKT
jgi:hypothetical protein